MEYKAGERIISDKGSIHLLAAICIMVKHSSLLSLHLKETMVYADVITHSPKRSLYKKLYKSLTALPGLAGWTCWTHGPLFKRWAYTLCVF